MRTNHRIIFGDSRRMDELPDESVHLVVTSPPYPMVEMWDDLFRRLDPRIDETWRRMEAARGEERESLIRRVYDLMHENLDMVWGEVRRVLVRGGIACVNVGDATRSIGGMFRLFPNHSRVIDSFERMGFVTLPYILWKKPTNRPNAFLGSGFLPPNAYVTLDVEFILVFRKGRPREFKPGDPLRYASSYTREERDRWFSQIWEVRGERQVHPGVGRRTAAFPLEIPRRLIRMFSVVGDMVLDPFLGTGTTTRAAAELGRNSVGYEIDESLRPVIEEKIGRIGGGKAGAGAEVEFIRRGG